MCMSTIGTSFTSALTALGVGSALLVYIYNKEPQKCGLYAKIVGYFIVAAALASILCSVAALRHCHSGSSRGSKPAMMSGTTLGGDTKACDKSAAASKDECCMKKDGKSTEK